MSYTWVSDGNNVYVGQYKRSGGQTQHRRLADYTGMGYVGGSYNRARPDYVNGVGYNSRTLNRPSLGMRNISNTSVGRACGAKVSSGNVYKAYNTGMKARVWYNSVTDDIQVLY
eukprot:164532_1